MYVQKAEKNCVCQLLFLAEIVPTFIFGRIMPKTLFTAKNIEPSMNATSSLVPTAKSGFGCQNKSLARSSPKIKIGMIVPEEDESVGGRDRDGVPGAGGELGRGGRRRRLGTGRLRGGCPSITFRRGGSLLPPPGDHCVPVDGDGSNGGD